MRIASILAGYAIGCVVPAGLAQAQATNREVLAAAAQADPIANACATSGAPLALSGSQWNGWGRDLTGARYQPDPGFSAAQVPRLRVKWAFALDGGIFSQPTVVGDRLFVSTIPGRLYALDAASGCVHWTYRTAAGNLNWGAGARAAVVVGALPDSGGSPRYAAYIGDDKSYVHALDAATGKRIWATQIETHPFSRISGSPVLHAGRLYVPVSSLEEAVAGDDKFPCCTFRGSVVALDPVNGRILWKTYAISEEPKPFKKNRIGTQMYGPSGAAIWSTPTIDVRRGVLYTSTGNSYTEAEQEGASAIIAMDLVTGAIRWTHQVMKDNYLAIGCGRQPPPANCPSESGPDFDFGSSPIIRTLPNGNQVLVAVNKGGLVFAMDPDAKGKMLWTQRVGTGSSLGGTQWGASADADAVYVPTSDFTAPRDKQRPGLTALRIATGEVIWHVPAPPAWCSWGGDAGCSNAQSMAVSMIPGIVFSGSLDGHIRAYSTGDGKIVWSFDTARPYEAVNGRPANGGSLDGAGPTIANGRLFVTSGYDRFWGRQRGNVLLAFTVDGK